MKKNIKRIINISSLMYKIKYFFNIDFYTFFRTVTNVSSHAHTRTHTHTYTHTRTHTHTHTHTNDSLNVWMRGTRLRIVNKQLTQIAMHHFQVLELCFVQTQMSFAKKNIKKNTM